MNFISIDFETANQQWAPCSVGYAVVYDNKIEHTFYSLIDPKQPFTQVCMMHHGLTPDSVSGAPEFPEIYEEIIRYAAQLPVVSHNVSFEKIVLEKSVRRYLLDMPPVVYYDTMRIFKDNYLIADGSSLPAVCKSLDIEFINHHNAHADAVAAAQVMIEMSSNANNKIREYARSDRYDCRNLGPVDEFIPTNNNSFFSRFVDPNNFVKTTASLDSADDIVINGSSFVVTGTIKGVTRPDLYDFIKRHGGSVCKNVSYKIDYLIVGDQDLSIVTDTEGAKSIKIINAESIRAAGGKIKIIDAEDFTKLMSA